jgi:hypothetical protein
MMETSGNDVRYTDARKGRWYDVALEMMPHLEL